MEEGLLEHMYGDLHSDSPVAHDEDSVDIYCGLDSSPRNSKNAEKPCALFSPRRLKDSLDLYEDIIKEEQQEKEATCNELKTKLDAAQNHVKELLQKLQQIQIQNTSLNTENTCLKKNICALIKTARMEIVRKDDEISRLNQRGGRGGYPSLTRSQMSFQRNQDFSQNSVPTHDSTARPETQGSRVNCVPKGLPKPHSEAISVSVHPEPPATSVLAPPFSENSRFKRTSSTLPDRPSDSPVGDNDRDCNILPTPNQKGPIQQTRKSYPENNDKQKVCGKQPVVSQDKSRSSQCSEGGDYHAQDHHSVLDASKENKLNSREKSSKESKPSEKDCMNSNSGRHRPSNSELHRSLERGKSPPHQRNHSPPTGSSYRTASSSHSQKMRSRDMEPPAKSGSRESRRNHSRDRGDRNALESFGREGKRSGSDQGRLTNKSSASSSHKGSGSPMREHCRKEERSREERSWNRERKGNGTDKNKEYERNKKKDTDKSLRDSNRKNVEDKKDKELESNVNSKNGKQTTPNTLTTSTDSCDLVKKGQEVRKGQDKHLAVVQAKVLVKNSVEPEFAVGREAGEKSLPEEGNRTRKLSFMETLNLTLSPVKKPRLSSGGKEQETSQSKDTLEVPEEETSQFNFGEEYCVIDELGSSNEMDDVFESPAAESSGICEAEKGQGLHPELGFKNVEKENAQDKEEGAVQMLISSMQAKCNSERIVDKIVLQSANSKFLTASVDQPTKLATSQEPIECKDSGSISKLVDDDVMALTAESLNSATESLPGVSVVQTVLITDDIHVCSTNSEGRNSLDCEFPSVKFIDSVARDSAIVCVENCSPDNTSSAKSECQKTSLVILPESISQDASASVPIDTHPKGDGTGEEACDMSPDAVSSTVSVKVVSQSRDGVAADVMESLVISSTEPEKCIEKPVTDYSLTMMATQSAEMPKVSSTFLGEIVQSEQGHSGSLQMERVGCSSEPGSTEDEERNNATEPSSSVPVAHDEDSMMLTLKSIQHIPEAISPLTSPVRPVKKSLPHCSSNVQHVRSLSKDFSTLTGAKRMDVNKENEKPHCSSTQFPHMDTNQTPSSPSSSEDNELEEGEIVSDSEEDEPLVIPIPQLRKTQSVTTIKKQPSPKSPRLAKKQAQKAAMISQGHSGMKSKTTPTPDSSPTSNKRHKSVLHLLPKTNPSSIPEVMDMLKLIQAHLRKKYMKFHKNFPKKSFANIVDMSLCSFTDFVNNVSFSKFCSLESILKPKLNHIISITMNKISNNGIVNRIFEQQSPSLKKKLWSFVESQFQFLFREIQATLTSLCNPPEERHFSKTENKVERNGREKNCKMPAKPVTTVPTLKKKAGEDDLVGMSGVQEKVKHPTITPHRTGLGSRGKNLKMNKEEEDQPSEVQALPSFHPPSKTAVTLSKNSSSGEKPAACVRRLSHNGSVQDKSDFEILTEQQTSSLTFNLVTDSQMGEIFKCLLQGSDLLENSVSVGDAHSWPLGTPRKDVCGESSLVVTTPNKTTLTPSKIITTWSTISPCKPSSSNPKIHIPLNPAILDESCLLEVPSGSQHFCKGTPSSTVPSQRSYSILAEDLAVSLTIPSPLKSDGHLSFLHPESAEPASVPESVISAHYSEDALMDGEDATEQDIHLALDSDNSSAGSSGCRTWEEVAMPTFQFKPHLPMQAVVMEKSNDHFIVRIRHTSTSFASSPDQNPTSAEKESKKVMGASAEWIDSAHSTSDTFPNENSPGKSQSPASCENPDLHVPNKVPLKDSLLGSSPRGKTVNCRDGNAAHSHGKSAEPAPTNRELAESASVSELVIFTEEGSVPKKSSAIRKKRKKHHSEPRAKRVKMEHTQEKAHKQRKKRSSSGSKDKGIGTPRRKRSKPKLPPLSPNSLSAKNVIRKKGEVVVTWTRDEDRDILLDLKLRGASPDTFSALSAKMNKSPAMIAERVCQLMKLFKKKERMDS